MISAQTGNNVLFNIGSFLRVSAMFFLPVFLFTVHSFAASVVNAALLRTVCNAPRLNQIKALAFHFCGVINPIHSANIADCVPRVKRIYCALNPAL